MSQLDLGDWLSKNQRRKGGLSLGSIKQVSSGYLCSHSCRYLPINKCGVLRGCAVSLKNKNRNCRLLCWQHFYIIDVCKKLKKIIVGVDCGFRVVFCCSLLRETMSRDKKNPSVIAKG